MIENSSDYKKYLLPQTISKLKSLDLKAKLIVEGFMVGLHKSPYHGFSVEFSEHRQYMQGDNLKDIDWKVYGKTEKYFIKQYEEETNLRCHILIDTSNSMAYSSNLISKMEYAKTLAASLAYLMIKQHDAVGVVSFSDRINKFLPPKSSLAYLNEILKTFSLIEPSGSTNTADSINMISSKIKRRGMIIVISDFFDDPYKIMESLKHFRYLKNEVIVFQILDPKEIDFDFKDASIFKDLESQEEITTQPYQIQKAYKEAFSNYMKNLKEECLNSKIDYNIITTDMPFDKALYSFIQKRYKMV